MPIKVLLADDVAIMRRRISRVLDQESTIELVGAAADSAELIQMANDLGPDVIVMDLHMAGNREHGFREIKPLLNDNCRLLAISFSNDAEAMLLAKSLDAAELLDKMHLSQELIPTIIRLASSSPIEPEAE